MVRILAAATVLGAISSAEALRVTFKNACTFQIDLYSREGGATTADPKTSIAIGSSAVREFGKDFEGHFRYGQDDAATLIEFSTKGTMNFVWYDISIIPPQLNKGYEFCNSLDECKANSQSKKGFNVPVQMTPTANTNGNQCRELTCPQDGCPDAYLFPKDDTKTHACDLDTDFTVTFCPSGSSSGGSPSPYTPAATTAKPTSAPPATQAPATQTPSTPTPTSVTPTVTPAPTSAPTQAPTPAPTPAPAPSQNGKIHVPDVEKLVIVPQVPSPTTPTPTTQAPTPAPAPTTSQPPAVPAAVPVAQMPKKKVKHCV